MKLYLIRHGDAEAKDPRPLTAKGKNDARKTAKFLKDAKISVNEIWHSTKLRAKQTAEVIAQALGAKTIEKKGLKPNDPVAPLIDKLDKDIIIVGHLPFLSILTSLLVTGSDEKQLVAFESAAVVRLEKEDGNWFLSWMVTPDLLPARSLD